MFFFFFCDLFCRTAGAIVGWIFYDLKLEEANAKFGVSVTDVYLSVRQTLLACIIP